MTRVLPCFLFLAGCARGTPTLTSPPTIEVVPPSPQVDSRSDILLARAGCTRTDSNDEVTVFDAFGWVESETNQSFTTTYTYERIEGQLLQRSFVDTGGFSNVQTFDAFENIESWTRGTDLQFACTFAQFEDGRSGEQTCRYGQFDVVSTLDACGEVVRVEAGARTSTTEITYTRGCIRSRSVTDSSGLLDTFEFDDEGRETRRLYSDSDNPYLTTYTWECPES